MFKETILENEEAVLWYHPEVKIIHYHIKHYVFGQRLRKLLDTGYELLKEKGSQKWLSDDRNNNVLTIEDKHWALNNWLPRVASAGWKYWALVPSEMIIGQTGMQEYVNEGAKVGVTVKIFTNPDKALEWLNQL
ncbi:MAG TPA: hypothetical protein DDW50_19555 [Firmicutes bacterium]|jgi:hypothetical protein|nr:hypothetical protein [Bacillota bacterium]